MNRNLSLTILLVSLLLISIAIGLPNAKLATTSAQNSFAEDSSPAQNQSSNISSENIITATLASVPSTSAVPVLPLHNWQIACSEEYVNYINQTNELAFVSIQNADGTHKQKILVGNATFIEALSGPQWSPDGKMIAVSCLEGTINGTYTEYMTILSDSGQILNKIKLNGDYGNVVTFSWAGDGKSIIYEVYFDGLYLLDIDTGESKQVLISSQGCLDHDPVWSPDMSKLAFVHHEWGYNFYVCLINFNSSKVPYSGNDWYKNFSNPEINLLLSGMSLFNANLNLQWTLDGSKLVISVLDSNSTGKIYVVDISTKVVCEMSLLPPATSLSGFGESYKAKLSHNGNEIAFSDWNNELTIVNIDGSNLRKMNLTQYGYRLRVYDPLTWSTDGQHIIFNSNQNLCIVKNDGNNLVTYNGSSYGYYDGYWLLLDGVDWCPVPASLANNAPIMNSITSISLSNQQRNTKINLENYVVDETSPSFLEYRISNSTTADPRLTVSIDENHTLHIGTSANWTGTSNVTVEISDEVLSSNYTLSVYVDTLAPTISVLSPENRTYNSSSLLLNVTLNDPVLWLGYSLDGKANVTISQNSTLSGLSEGLHNLKVYANDTAGNMAVSQSVSFTIDTKRSLNVVSAHSTPNPAVGSHIYNDGTSVTCSAPSSVTEGNTVWTCTGWTGTGSVPSSGSTASLTFTITQDSNITWNWQGTPTPTPSVTPTPTPSVTPTPTPSVTPTPTPSVTPTPTPSVTPTPTPSVTPTPTPSVTPTPTPSVTPTPTPSVTPTPTPSVTPTPTPSVTPTPTPSPTPTTPTLTSTPAETTLYLYVVAVIVILAIIATTVLLIKKNSDS